MLKDLLKRIYDIDRKYFHKEELRNRFVRLMKLCSWGIPTGDTHDLSKKQYKKYKNANID